MAGCGLGRGGMEEVVAELKSRRPAVPPRTKSRRGRAPSTPTPPDPSSPPPLPFHLPTHPSIPAAEEVRKAKLLEELIHTEHSYLNHLDIAINVRLRHPLRHLIHLD